MADKSRTADFQLRERLKELRCLYDLSRIAWEADNDLPTIVNKTLHILPAAMQYPGLAEAAITIDGKVSTTAGFDSCA